MRAAGELPPVDYRTLCDFGLVVSCVDGFVRLGRRRLWIIRSALKPKKQFALHEAGGATQRSTTRPRWPLKEGPTPEPTVHNSWVRSNAVIEWNLNRFLGHCFSGRGQVRTHECRELSSKFLTQHASDARAG